VVVVVTSTTAVGRQGPVDGRLIRIDKRGRGWGAAVQCTTSVAAANILTWEPVCSHATFHARNRKREAAAAALMLISELHAGSVERNL
jgi:hypothetical protein